VNSTILKIENLEKYYDNKRALDHISFEVREGEIFGLLGPNGGGKTTIINCIFSLLTYEQGEISIFHQSMNPGAVEIKREMGYVPQNSSVFEELTVYDNILYFCSLYKANKKQARWFTERILKFTSLSDYRKFYPNKLSGGLLKRLNIACGIVHKPRFIIMDEPAVAADTNNKNKIIDTVLALKKEKATIFYASHNVDEVERLCDRIALIDRGKIFAVGTKAELKSMISLGEQITITVDGVGEEQKKEIRLLPNVYDVKMNQNELVIKSKKGRSNLVSVISYLNGQNIAFGEVKTKSPTLKDVFLEITGKSLMD
jgi:ABC-2 type transport system ATP-binding protein